MKRYRELTIVISNKPGTLAPTLAAMARSKINIVAMQTSAGYDLNMVRFVVSDPQKCKAVLKKMGHGITDATVLGIQTVDRPGQLSKLTAAFGRAKININYMYATVANHGEREALVIFHVTDVPAAERAMRRTGLLKG